jgi:hypothetical protein
MTLEYYSSFSAYLGQAGTYALRLELCRESPSDINSRLRCWFWYERLLEVLHLQQGSCAWRNRLTSPEISVPYSLRCCLHWTVITALRAGYRFQFRNIAYCAMGRFGVNGHPQVGRQEDGGFQRV